MDNSLGNSYYYLKYIVYKNGLNYDLPEKATLQRYWTASCIKTISPPLESWLVLELALTKRIWQMR